ncbi:MAG: recombination-associated protein RdgC [Panacagrimonas sp.]
MPVWFRNLLPYRLNTPWTLAPGALEERLSARRLQPCTGLAAQSQGWVSPRGDQQLVYGQGRQSLIAFGTETKILPASVVKDAAQDKATEIEKRMGFKPGKKQLREIKEQITAELLPRAFAKRRSTRAWIDAEAGWLLVDTASLKRGDELTAFLRETLGELAIEPMNTAQSPLACMTAWLATGKVPGYFALDQDCEMKSGGDDPAAVRFARHGLEGEDVRQHVKKGKSVTQLGLTWSDRMRLVLADPRVVKRVRFEMIEQDRAEHDASGNADERFDADFALMCGELSKLLADLLAALGGHVKK